MENKILDSERIERIKLINKKADKIVKDKFNIDVINDNKVVKTNKFSIIDKIEQLFTFLSNYNQKRKQKNKHKLMLADFYSRVRYSFGKFNEKKLTLKDKINKLITKYKFILNIRFGLFPELNAFHTKSDPRNKILKNILNKKDRVNELSTYKPTYK